jgi:hypothetical protein
MGLFYISKFIEFFVYLDICYVKIHTKVVNFVYIKTTYNFGQRKYLLYRNIILHNLHYQLCLKLFLQVLCSTPGLTGEAHRSDWCL